VKNKYCTAEYICGVNISLSFQTESNQAVINTSQLTHAENADYSQTLLS